MKPQVPGDFVDSRVFEGNAIYRNEAWDAGGGASVHLVNAPGSALLGQLDNNTLTENELKSDVGCTTGVDCPSVLGGGLYLGPNWALTGRNNVIWDNDVDAQGRRVAA